VEGTVLFTFAHPSDASGSGITEHRTAKGEMLGIVDNSCDFGFHCIVPECPFPIDRADATHVARLQVEVMVKAPADAETRASAGNEGNQDFGKGRQLFKDDVKQFRITDTDVDGGYVYWSSGLQERADKAMSFSKEVQALRSESDNVQALYMTSDNVQALTPPAEMEDEGSKEFTPAEIADAAATAAAGAAAGEAGAAIDMDDNSHEIQGRRRQKKAEDGSYHEYRSMNTKGKMAKSSAKPQPNTHFTPAFRPPTERRQRRAKPRSSAPRSLPTLFLQNLDKNFEDLKINKEM
jgi:hypothetical protein